MLRSLSKVAGTATAAVASVSSAAAHAEFPMKKYRDNAHSRLAKPYPGPQHIDDEYDFCQEEIYGSFIGGVPSPEEVDEATRDLQATFVQNEGYRSSTVFKHVNCEDETMAAGEAVCLKSKDACGDEQEFAAPSALMTVSPPELLKPGTSVERNYQAVTVGGANVVARCVDLLHRDPDIQAAVVSLARDPAIWDAFVKNERVQELLRSKNLSLPSLEGTSREESRAAKDGHENPFLKAFVGAKKLIFEMMDTLVDMVSNVFGFFDQKFFGGKENDPLNHPLKACMVLTILILALVVLKRVQ